MKKWMAFILAAMMAAALVGCGASNQELQEEPEGKAALTPMVMVGGVLYFDTGRESTIDGRCGTPDGEITSTVDVTERPVKNDQSNFGAGFAYQYGEEETIEIERDGKWWVYESEMKRETRNQENFEKAASEQPAD